MHVLQLGELPPDPVRVVRRDAAKAIVEVGGRLLLLRTPATGDLKLPGGGIRDGESAEEALRRELVEECGRAVAEVGPPVVTVVERRADLEDPRAGFEMASTYHRATLTEETRPRDLDDYEARLGLEPVWLRLDEALASLDAVLLAGAAAPWTARERQVLALLAGAAPGPRS